MQQALSVKIWIDQLQMTILCHDEIYVRDYSEIRVLSANNKPNEFVYDWLFALSFPFASFTRAMPPNV